MGSSRLPGKVLLNLDQTNTMLDYVISQLKNCKFIDKIIVATTNLKEDKAIVTFCKKNKINFFIGSSEDVLDRYYQCAKIFSISTVVRITADCPLVDPNIVDKLISKYIHNSFDVVVTHHPRSFPHGIADIEIFSVNLLEKIWKDAKKPSEREHVTLYFYNNRDKFKVFNFKNNANLSKIKLSVDRNEDLELVKKIIQHINNRPILISNILHLFKKNPEFFKINSDFILDEGLQKSLKEDKILGF
jgi:spore coat polysaccharide biosynthesis protein SpsF (cytidylyltransferase family)